MTDPVLISEVPVTFKLTVKVEGPDTRGEGQYERRATLAALEVEVTPEAAWEIFSSALDDATG